MNKLNNIAKSISYVTAGIIAIKIIGLFYVIYVIRSVAVEQYGIYSYAATIVGIMALLVDFGFGQLLIKDYNNQKHLKKTIFSTALAIKITFASIIYIGVLFYSHYSNGDVVAAKILVVYSSTLFWGAIQRNLLTLLRAQEKFKIQNILSVIVELVLLTGGVVVIKMGFGIFGLVWSSVVISFAFAMFSLLILAKQGYAGIKNVNIVTTVYLIKNSYPLCLVSLITLIFFRIDTIILKTISGNYTVGLYSAVYTLAAAFLIIPSIFFSVMFPVFSRLSIDNKSNFDKSLDKSLKYLTLISLPIAVGGCLLSDKIILIAYGDKYASAGVILSVLYPFLIFSFINSLMQHAIIIKGGQKYMVIGIIVAALFNITANLLLIPKYGAFGASITTVLSEITLFILYSYIFHKSKLAFRKFYNWTLKAIISTGIMAGVVELTKTHNIIVPFGLGSVVYLISLYIFKTFDADDVIIMKSVMPVKRR